MEFQADAGPENLAHWLIEQKTLSKYQADILLAGGSGPFRFANYTVFERGDQAVDNNTFHARHRLTNHPVLLEFIGGADLAALENWNRAQHAASCLVSNNHAHLVSAHEIVALPEYRFIVTAQPRGQRLSTRIPAKARLEPENAALIVGQIAAALHHLHELGLVHGNVSADYVWIEKLNHIQLQIPFARLPAPWSLTEQSRDVDTRGLGALWYRLLSGSSPFAPDSPTALRKDLADRLEAYSIPEKTARQIKSLLLRPDTPESALPVVIEQCQAIAAVEATGWPVARFLPTSTAFEAWLARTPEVVSSIALEDISAADLPFAESDRRSPVETVVDLKTFGDRNSENLAKTFTASRRRSRFSRYAGLAGSLLAIAALIAIVIASTMNRPNAITLNSGRGTVGDAVPIEFPDAGTHPVAENSVDAGTSVSISEPAAARILNQVLIADDGESLWETPTVGPSIDFSFVPHAPKIAFAFRPAELLQSEQGLLLLQALGPDLNMLIENWLRRIGVPLTELKQVLLTLHSGEEVSYESFAMVQLQTPVSREKMISDWGSPTPVTAADGTTYFVGNDELCFLFPNPSSEPLSEPNSDINAEQISRFAVGPRQLVEESIELQGVDPLSGSMRTLASWSDRNRHVTILFLRADLFNEAGQELMGGTLTQLNRQLRLLIDNNIRGGLFSLQLDGGTYMELRFDQTADMKNAELESYVRKLLVEIRDTSSSYVNSLASDSYWDGVRTRFARMVGDFSQSWRIGTERKHVIANCWMPPNAAHNLAAAAELVVNLGRLQAINEVATSDVPASLDELLAMPRDLSVVTNPDLIILINDLQQEILDNYGQLPFDFEIRLRGGDLSKEGITQNQRPGDFEIHQRPLSEILTQIMVKANPKKDITGPSDIDCKLVWVVAEDPDDPSRKIIMITTRSAAAENSWPLPPAFED